MQETRDALQRWMKRVLRDRGWTAAEWARRAGVTPTNLTRFLRDPHSGSLPGADTLGRLARAAGSEPRFLANGHEPSVWHVPLLTLAQLQTLLAIEACAAADFLGAVLRETGACVPVDRRTSPRAFALRVGSHHLNAGGVIVDDRIVVEPVDVVPPGTGDLVIVLDGDSVCAYRYYAPYLVPVSTDSGCVPMRWDGARVVGIGVHVSRPLRA